MSFISYQNVVDGLIECLGTIPGFTAYWNLLDYEPDSVQSPPLIYTLLDGFTRSAQGQITIMRYRILVRLVIQWQDHQAAEQELRDRLHEIPAAIDVDPTLGGRIDRGLAEVSDGQSGFVRISNTQFRCLDYFVSAPTKSPVRSGI